MAGAIQHVFSNAIPDGTNDSIVRPSDWNSIHAYTMVDAISAGNTRVVNGEVVFSNSNGVTFGLSGSTVTATVATNYQSQGAYLTTAMGSNRGSDFVQATAAFAGTNANGTIASAGISVSVPAQSNQTAGLYASSNTYLTSSGTVDARSLSFRGDKSITIGVSAGEVVFSVGAYLTTAMASNRGADFVQATAAFAGTNASGTVASDGVSVSVAAQTNQSLGLYASSNTTLTSSGTLDARSFSVRAIGSLTAGFSNGELLLSAPNALTTAMASNAVTLSNVRVSAGTTSNLLSAITFADSNGLAFGINASTITASYTVPTQSNQTIGIYASSNTTLTSSGTVDARSLSVRAIGSLTAGYSNGELLLSAPNALTTAALSGDTSKYVQAWEITGNTAGTTSSAPGTKMYFSGGNSLTVSGNGNTINFSVGNYLTTAMLSNAVTLSNIRVSAGTTSNLLSAVTFADSNGLAFGINASTITASYTVPTVTAGSDTLGMSNLGNTSGTTGVVSGDSVRLLFAGGNNITLSQSINGASGTITISAFAQTNQTLGLYMSSNTTSSVSSGTVDARSLTFRGVGVASVGYSSGEVIISVPAAGGALTNINVSGGTTSNNLSAITFADSNGISWGVNASTITATVATYSTVGTATTGYPVASAGSIGTITRWAAEDHRHAGIGAIGISTSGGTAGTTGSVVGTYWLQGGQNITVSQITSNNGSHTLVVSAGGLKLSAGTSSINATDYTFSNSNGYSFGLNGSTVTAQGPYVGYLEPYPMTNTALFGPGAGTWYIAPFVAPNSMSGGRINFLMQNTGTAQLFRDFTEASVVSSSTGGQQQGYTYSLAVAIFSQGTGTNSTRLESNWSNSFSFGWTKSVSVSSSNVSQFKVTVAHSISYISDIGSNGAYTLVQYANSSNSQVANSSTASNFADSIFSSGRNLVSGSVMYPIGLNTTLSAGNYWIGFAWSTTRSNASTGTRIASALDFSQSSMVGISRLELETLYRNFGSTVTTARSHIMPYGLFTAAANMAPPANIALSSDLSSLASAWVPYFNVQLQGLTK